MGKTRISRGRFLKMVGTAGATGSALSVLAACQTSTTPQQSGGGGGGGNTLHIYNWAQYLAPYDIKHFEKKFGMNITQDTYSSNEELLAKLQGGGTGYDVIVPSDYMVSIMAKSKVIQKLDMSKIPNFKNVSKHYRGLPFDPKNEYSVPYQAGTTGILYNKKKVGRVETWDPLWDPKFKGKMAMINDVRETIGAALMRRGYSENSTDPRKLQQAKQDLIKQKPLLQGYFDSVENVPMVRRGDIWLAHVYSGDGFLAIVQDKNLAYAIPKPGATLWVDNLCIPVGAPHVDLAHKFLNFILAPKPGAALTEYTDYSTPNQAAVPLVHGKFTKIPQWDPSGKVYDRLQTIRDIGKATRTYERIFTEVKSS